MPINRTQNERSDCAGKARRMAKAESASTRQRLVADYAPGTIQDLAHAPNDAIRLEVAVSVNRGARCGRQLNRTCRSNKPNSDWSCTLRVVLVATARVLLRPRKPNRAVKP